MGTISDKLTYLNGTKQAIKDELNRFGADLTENDTFRSYSNVLNDIYDKLPKVSGNGSNFTLENVQNGKLDLFEMKGNTEQDSYSGKNLYQAPTTPSLTDKATYSKINDNSFSLTYTQSSSTNTSAYVRIDFDISKLKPNTQYTISKKQIITGTNFNRIGSLRTYINGSYGSVVTDNNVTFTTLNEITSVGIAFYLSYQNTTTGTSTITFYDVQLEESSTPTSYEPYVGGTPSPSPDYPQPIRVVKGDNTIKVTGKNLFDGILEIGMIDYDTGVNANNNNRARSKNYIPINTLTFTIIREESFSSAQTIGLRYYDKNFNYIGRDAINGFTNYATKTVDNSLDTSKTVAYMRFILMTTNDTSKTFCIRTDNGTTYEPYQEQTYPIALHGKNLCSSVELQSASNIRFYIDKKIEKTLTISFTTNERLNNNSLYLSATNTLATTITADTNTKATATFTLSDEQYSAIQNATNPYFLLFKSGDDFTVPNDAQIENGSTAPTDYEPYYNYELCKIGDYQDYFYKENDKWYLHKEIGKIVLNGSEENWDVSTIYGTTITNRFVLRNSLNNNFIANIGLCDKFINRTSDMPAGDYECLLVNNNSIYISINIDRLSENTVQAFKTWLSTHNLIVYYILATPTYETITNETLISQLEAIETKTGTNIFEVSNDNDVLPELVVSRLKELDKLS